MYQLDIAVFKLINLRLASPSLDHLMAAASVFGTGAAQTALCLASLFWSCLRDRNQVRTAAYAGLAACGVSVVITQLVKHLWSRPRPLATIFEARTVGKALFWNSFPSGHTANVFAVAVAIGTFLPKSRIVLFPLAALTAISRVYVGAHYPTDILGGAALGVIIGSYCAALFHTEKRSPRSFASNIGRVAAPPGATLSQRATYAALVVLCLVLFFWRLGSVPLMGLDEGLYSECAREMAAGGSWIVPSVNGEPFFDKPPLAYWLMAISIKIFGVNSFAARLPSCLSAFALIALSYVLSKKLYGPKTAWVSATVLAASLMTVGLARMAILDMLFTLTLTAALGTFILTRASKLPQWGYIVVGASTGLSTLAKGPAGLVLIVLTIAAHVALTAKGSKLENHTRTNVRLLVLSAFVCLAVALPWYTAVTIKTHGAFLREFIIHQNLQRALGQDFHHNMPFYFYLPIYLIGFFPWSVFLPAAWARYVRTRPQNSADESALFAAVWIVTVVGVYSLMRSKLPAYIYPAFPPSALLVGRLWAELLEPDADPKILRSLRRSGFAAFLLALIVGSALVAGLKALPKPIPRLETALVPMAVSLAAGAGISYLALRGQHIRQAIAALLLGVIGLLLAAIALGLPIAAASMGEPVVQVARQIKQTARTEEPVVGYLLPSSFASLPFYSERAIIPAKSPREISCVLARSSPCLVVTPAFRSKDLPSSKKQVARWGGYVIYRLGNAAQQ
ncbi:MAG: phosphatase PAP2 family protein [Armatimonadota bacterium]|nr:phosphatase PAP2 family protein [Armatimonadota bacterium]